MYRAEEELQQNESPSTTKFFKYRDALCEGKKEISITSIKTLPK